MAGNQERINALAILSYIDSRIDSDPSFTDRIGIFYPLILEAVAKQGTHPFSTEDICDYLRLEYGFTLPMHVADTLISRCKKGGYVAGRRDNYRRTDKQIDRTDLPRRNLLFEKRYKKTVINLVEFFKTQGVEVNSEQAEQRLISFLELTFGTSVLEGEVEGAKRFSSTKDRVLGKYLEHVATEDSDDYDIIRRLAQGMVVRQVVLYPGVEEKLPPLRGLVVYLDSTVICKLAGFDTPQEQAYVTQAVRVLKHAGVSIRVFDATISEIQGILQNVMNNWGKPVSGLGPKAYSLQMPKNGFTRSDVNLWRNDTESKIRSQTNIRMDCTPQRETQYVLDERKLEERLRDKDNKEGPGISARVRHDVNCIAGILTIRAGKTSRQSIAKAKALFVSDSPRTIANVNKWWRQDEGRDDIPPIFSLTALANYAWLRDPQGQETGEALIDTSLLLACSTALLPTDAMWSHFTERLRSHVSDGSISKENVAAIILHTDLTAIMSELEDQNWSGDELCDETVRRAIDSLQEPVRAEAAAERAKLETAAFERLEAVKQEYKRDAEVERRSHAAERQSIEAERDKALSDLADEREQAVLQRERQIDKLCSLVVFSVGMFIFFACVIALFLRHDALFERMSKLLSDGSFTNATRLDLSLEFFGSLSFFGSCFTKTRGFIAKLVRPLVVRWYDKA